jgi:hypothetical protein
MLAQRAQAPRSEAGNGSRDLQATRSALAYWRIAVSFGLCLSRIGTLFRLAGVSRGHTLFTGTTLTSQFSCVPIPRIRLCPYPTHIPHDSHSNWLCVPQ